MKVSFHHDAESKFDSLADRLESMVEPIVPLVETVTGLALPDHVVIRTMTVRKWMAMHRRLAKSQLRSETQELQPSVDSQRAAKAKVASLRKSRRAMWPGIGGQVGEFGQGQQPELVILPQALQEAGRLDDDRVQSQIIAHELTHLAQHAADNGAMWRLMTTFYPVERGIADRDIGSLREGHAYWADQQVTQKLFGAPVKTGESSPHASFVYRLLASTSLRSESLKILAAATDSVAEVIDSVGLNAFNKVWYAADLVPLKSESSNSKIWRQRFA